MADVGLGLLTGGASSLLGGGGGLFGGGGFNPFGGGGGSPFGFGGGFDPTSMFAGDGFGMGSDFSGIPGDPGASPAFADAAQNASGDAGDQLAGADQGQQPVNNPDQQQQPPPPGQADNPLVSWLQGQQGQGEQWGFPPNATTPFETPTAQPGLQGLPQVASANAGFVPQGVTETGVQPQPQAPAVTGAPQANQPDTQAQIYDPGTLTANMGQDRTPPVGPTPVDTGVDTDTGATPPSAPTPNEPGAQRQQRQQQQGTGGRGGSPIEQLLRQMGLPGPLAALVQQAIRSGMFTGGQRGGFPGFPGFGGRFGRFGRGRGGFLPGRGGQYGGSRYGGFFPRAPFPRSISRNGLPFPDINSMLQAIQGGQQGGQQPSAEPGVGGKGAETDTGAQPGTDQQTDDAGNPLTPTTPSQDQQTDDAGNPLTTSATDENGNPIPAATRAPAAVRTAPAIDPNTGRAVTPSARSVAIPPHQPGMQDGLDATPNLPAGHPDAEGTRRPDAAAAARGTNTGGIPQRIVAQARSLASQGPGAVAQFMRQQGFPRSGPWCGEFAASVMHSQGLPVPRNPAVASNWRTIGQPTNNPQPGDIAVRRNYSHGGGYVPTGQPGSHVTTVTSVQGGRFVGTGGNQGGQARASNFNVRDYEFRTFRWSGSVQQQQIDNDRRLAY